MECKWQQVQTGLGTMELKGSLCLLKLNSLASNICQVLKKGCVGRGGKWVR